MIDPSPSPPQPAPPRLLRPLLAFKIVGTIILFCVPMLALRPETLGSLYGLEPEPRLIAQLVGGAYAALIVGYAGGWIETGRGRFPGWVVAMGIVSNGGGFVLALLALWSEDVGIAQLRPFGFAAIGFAGLVAIGLIGCFLSYRRSVLRSALRSARS